MQNVFDLPLTEAMQEVCSRFPDRVAALTCSSPTHPRVRLTYRELDESAARLATELGASSVATNEPIIVFVSNAPEDLVLLFGIWRSGAVAVPLYVDIGPETVRTVLQFTKARFLLLKEGVVEHALPQGHERQLAHARLRVLDQPPPEHGQILNDAALIMFTSGSTGTSKGVVLSRKSLMDKLKANNSVLHFPEGVRSFLVLKLSFAFGLWVSILTLLSAGTLLMARRFEVSDFVHILLEEQIDQVAVVPTMLRAVLNELRMGDSNDLISTLADSGRPWLICTGGEPIAPAVASYLRRLLPRSGIADVFGLTETCTSDFILAPDKFDQYLGSVGFPGPGISFRVAERETGNVVPIGEVGELEINSPYMMNGYLGEPELTHGAFRDEYFRTGDLARQGVDGELYLAGRCKDLILRGGNKVSPVEIDAIMMQHPQIAASLTTGVNDSLMGERIHTLVVIRGERRVEPEVLRSWAKTRLDKFKVPDRIHIGKEIPQGVTGKDDRRALHSWLSSAGLLDE